MSNYVGKMVARTEILRFVYLVLKSIKKQFIDQKFSFFWPYGKN